MITSKRAQEWLAEAPNEVLQLILRTLSEQESADEPSEQYPLAGRVHMTGVGHVPTAAIRAELAGRERPDPEPEQPRFVIEIALGNEAMQTGRDVADALMRTALHIEDNTMAIHEGNAGLFVGAVIDRNGNTVGSWEVTA